MGFKEGKKEMETTSEEVLKAVLVFRELIKEKKVAFVDRTGGTFEVDSLNVFTEGIALAGWKVR